MSEEAVYLDSFDDCIEKENGCWNCKYSHGWFKISCHLKNKSVAEDGSCDDWESK